MLQVAVVRENKEEYINRLERRGINAKELLNKVLEVDDKRRALQTDLDKKLAEELAERRLKEEKARKEKEIQDKELSRKRYNRETFLREQRYIRFVNPFEPINKNKLGSSQAWKKEKKFEYY